MPLLQEVITDCLDRMPCSSETPCRPELSMSACLSLPVGLYTEEGSDT
jgi:hypothetical protein